MIVMSESGRPGEPGGLSVEAEVAAAAARPPAGYAETGWMPEERSEMAAVADRRNSRSKLAAGWRGLKAAIRGDSSFFAHGYRGTLIVITAMLLRVDQRGWCLLVIGACLVLIAELAHSAVDTLARAVGDPEEPRLKNSPRNRRGRSAGGRGGIGRGDDHGAVVEVQGALVGQFLKAAPADLLRLPNRRALRCGAKK